MVSNQQKQKYFQHDRSEGISFIKQKIFEYNLENIQSICRTEYLDDIDTAILEVNLERATLENAVKFNEFVKAELDLNYKNLIIDTSKTMFMDSTFLGSVVRLLKIVNAKGNNLSMVVDFNKVKILTPFEQLKSILNIFPTIDAALAEIN